MNAAPPRSATEPPETRLGVWWIAEDQPGAIAIKASPSGVLTYGELVSRANRVSHALRSLGLKKDDGVAVLLPNDIDIIVWWFACQQMGLQFLPLNWHLSVRELSELLSESAPAVLLAHTTFSSLARQVLIEVPQAPWRNLALGGSDDFESADELLSLQPSSAPDRRSTGYPVSFTSGTTGRPKRVVRQRTEGDPSEAASLDGHTFARGFGLKSFDGPHLISAGMHHVAAQVFFCAALNAGHPLVIMPKFEPLLALTMISEHRVASAYMVPTMFHRLMQLDELVRNSFDTRSLKSIIHSAAPCPRDLKARMMQWWGPVIWEVYGGSESPIAVAKPTRWLERPGTVGRPLKGLTVSILDDAGKELPQGQPGHIYVTSPRAAFKYVSSADNEPSQEPANGVLSQLADRGQRFTLGDIGYVDEAGFLFICDRAKDMIITGGINVFPTEIESVLLSYMGVRDAAVIGLPDDEWGEVIKAVVVLEDQFRSTITEKALIEFLRHRLAHFKCPRSIDFVDTLPRTDAGKIYKRLLRDQYRIANDDTLKKARAR
jgi:long-chain acyl-CoA synthetase